VGTGRQKRRLDRRIGILLRGCRQCRRTGRIGRIRIRTKLKQEVDDRELVSRHGMVQGRAAMVTTRHPRSEHCRVSDDHRPHVVGLIERDRGPYIERSPVTEQVSATSPRT
jgi:hypothetical protein